jgi:hypothetical protein
MYHVTVTAHGKEGTDAALAAVILEARHLTNDHDLVPVYNETGGDSPDKAGPLFYPNTDRATYNAIKRAARLAENLLFDGPGLVVEVDVLAVEV